MQILHSKTIKIEKSIQKPSWTSSYIKKPRLKVGGELRRRRWKLLDDEIKDEDIKMEDVKVEDNSSIKRLVFNNLFIVNL